MCLSFISTYTVECDMRVTMRRSVSVCVHAIVGHETLLLQLWLRLVCTCVHVRGNGLQIDIHSINL